MLGSSRLVTLLDLGGGVLDGATVRDRRLCGQIV